MTMKKQTPTNLLIRSSLALTLAFAVLTPVLSQPAEPGDEKKMDSQMMEHCEKMKEQKKQMKADMKAQDDDLTAHAAKMNSAAADKKVDEVAALVTHMLEQRISMDARKAKMEEEMMEHMMKCPMMKDMKDMDHKPTDADKEPAEAKK
jgi:flagellar biosynthesis protein FliP